MYGIEIKMVGNRNKEEGRKEGTCLFDINIKHRRIWKVWRE